MEVHNHLCIDCGAAFDCDGDGELGSWDDCPVTICGRCREAARDELVPFCYTTPELGD